MQLVPRWPIYWKRDMYWKCYNTCVLNTAFWLTLISLCSLKSAEYKEKTYLLLFSLGKTQEVVLKKLEYIYAKQKAVEAQKQQQQAEPTKIVETEETTKPSEDNSSSSVFREIKPVIGSNKRTKPLILSRKGSCDTGRHCLKRGIVNLHKATGHSCK